MGSAAAGPGDRAHESVLDLPVGTRTDGRHCRNQGRHVHLVFSPAEIQIFGYDVGWVAQHHLDVEEGGLPLPPVFLGCSGVVHSPGVDLGDSVTTATCPSRCGPSGIADCCAPRATRCRGSSTPRCRGATRRAAPGGCATRRRVWRPVVRSPRGWLKLKKCVRNSTATQPNSSNAWPSINSFVSELTPLRRAEDDVPRVADLQPPVRRVDVQVARRADQRAVEVANHERQTLIGLLRCQPHVDPLLDGSRLSARG